MASLNLEDTIAAVSTPVGEGGIAVIRVSGKEAIPLVTHFFCPSKNGKLNEQPTHTIHHGHWVEGKENILDEVLVSLFRAPRSYTGEDVVEISCHGGISLTRRILEGLVREGARHAEPGEFTRRAFLHGRLDLTQAEAVLDLIRARSESSLQAAARQLQGSLSKKINHLKEALLKISAHLEAEIDFPDERLEINSREECLIELDEVSEEIQSLIASFKKGARLREGILTVIVGRPNVGKSSLLNALLERERALVSAIPGTTRDALEEEIEIAGIRLCLVDTAGLGTETNHPLDQMGRERTRSYLREGELFLWVLDGSSEWTNEDEAIFKEVQGKDFLLIVNKVDLPQKLEIEKLKLFSRSPLPCFLSCVTGTGVRELEKRIEEKISAGQITSESSLLTRLRHKQALEKALEALERTRKGMEGRASSELVLVDLKSGLDSLRELIGEIFSEDLLDVIFREFCIGK